MKRNRLWHEKEEFESAARMSDDLLKRSGAFARLPPNLLTLFGGLLTLPACLAFLRGWILAGALLFTICSLIDWLDGALARYQQRLASTGRLEIDAARNAWLRLGPTELGKKLDPIFDKIRYYGALIPLGWQTLPHLLIWISIGFALSLTVFRELVRLQWGLKPGANAWGKFKVYFEIATIAFLVFRAAGVRMETLPPLAFVWATALGGVSLVTQGWSVHRQLKHNRNP